MNPATARSLVPPRPNLGPEPWGEPDPIALYFVLGAAPVALLVAWFVWRRLGRIGARRPGRDQSSQNPRDISPRGRLIELSQSIRSALARQFGPAWRAKTNEELSADPRLAELLEHDELQDLIKILTDIDLLKFAPNRSVLHQESLEQQLATWEPRVAEFGKKIQAKPARRLKNGSLRSGPRNSRPGISQTANTAVVNERT